MVYHRIRWMGWRGYRFLHGITMSFQVVLDSRYLVRRQNPMEWKERHFRWVLHRLTVNFRHPTLFNLSAAVFMRWKTPVLTESGAEKLQSIGITVSHTNGDCRQNYLTNHFIIMKITPPPPSASAPAVRMLLDLRNLTFSSRKREKKSPSLISPEWA